MSGSAGRDSASDSDLLELALETAREAAALIRRERPAGRVRASDSKSSATDNVTAIDLASEQLVRARVARARPGDGFQGEEQAERPARTGITWVIDPIDGTTNFMYGIPAYAVSIAAVRTEPGTQAVAGPTGAGEAVAGVVLDVVSQEEFTAVRGGGAWLRRGRDAEAAPLAVMDPESLGQCLVATGFGYDPERRASQGRAVARLLPQVRDIRRFGAASLDLCAVAAGRVDAYVEQGLKPWDRAAGALIATEAGALVTGLDGGPADERMVVACAPRLHPDLSQLVRACGF